MLALYLALIDEEQDQITFERIYRDYHLQMLYVAKRYLCSQEDAEDAVQEALIRIAKKIKLIPTGPETTRRAYVLTLVKNVALRMKEKDRYEEVPLTPSVHRSSDGDPFEALCIKADFDLLLNALRRVPLHYREMLMLRYAFELPPREIAAILDRKETTVRQYIARGKKLLTDRYQEEVWENAEG